MRENKEKNRNKFLVHRKWCWIILWISHRVAQMFLANSTVLVHRDSRIVTSSVSEHAQSLREKLIAPKIIGTERTDRVHFSFIIDSSAMNESEWLTNKTENYLIDFFPNGKTWQITFEASKMAQSHYFHYYQLSSHHPRRRARLNWDSAKCSVSTQLLRCLFTSIQFERRAEKRRPSSTPGQSPSFRVFFFSVVLI